MSRARAARIVRKGMFQAHQTFCQEDGVPQLILTLVFLMLQGLSIEEPVVSRRPLHVGQSSDSQEREVISSYSEAIIEFY